MEKEKKEQVILVILATVFVLGLLYMRFQKSSPQQLPGMPEEIVSANGMIQEQPASKAAQSFADFSFSGEDPFKNILQIHLDASRRIEPEQEIKYPLPDFIIEGMVWNTEMPQAIVNGQVVRIGDIVEGLKILNIGKQGVTVDYAGENVLIKR